MIQSSSGHYFTTDTPLAAYLYCMGFEIDDIDYNDVRAKIIFKDNVETLYKHERLYYTDNAQVKPATYSRINKRLSTIIRRNIPWTAGVLNA